MQVFDIAIPDKPLSNFQLERYARQLEIPNFRGVFMKDTLPEHPRTVECGIVNFNTHSQLGSHWVCYYRNKDQRIYLDSYGQITPLEVQRYLKTGSEFQRGGGGGGGGSNTEKYRHCPSTKYSNVWTFVTLRTQITVERRDISGYFEWISQSDWENSV